MSEKDSEKKKSRRNNPTHIRDLLDANFAAFAPFLSHNPRRTIATMLLMAAKLQDKEILTGDDSLLRAKFAAKLVQNTGELAFALGQVLLAMELNDKAFFIDFGKCLSGEIKDTTVFDKRDRDMAEIIIFSPRMPAKNAVRELEKRGHRGITEENFRMWKMRLLKAKPLFDKQIAWCRNKISTFGVTDA
jgi:hypothetical protein